MSTPSFDFSDFDAILSAIEQEQTAQRGTRTAAPRQSVADLAAELFGENAALILKSGLQFSAEPVEIKPTKEGAPLNEPGRLQPMGGRNGDTYATSKNKALFMVRMCIIALAAQNKGKISTADVAAIVIGSEAQRFQERETYSFNTIAKAISERLIRPVKISNEYLEIPGIKLTPSMQKFCAFGNKLISYARATVK